MAITWARRLKRVFGIDINECEKCKGPVRIIACIEDPVVIEKILNHLQAKEANDVSPITRLPSPRAPPLLPMRDQGLTNKTTDIMNDAATGIAGQRSVADWESRDFAICRGRIQR